MAIFGLDDPAGYYQRTLGNPVTAMRYFPSWKDDWPGLQNEVDFNVRQMVEDLSRGNLNRMIKGLPCNLHKSVIYACVRGDSVGDCVAIDFETAFAKWFWRPNFDSPPYAPPNDGTLRKYVKEYVGTCGWLAEQLKVPVQEVRNALAGQSKGHERVIRDYLQDFYERRCAMDTRNPNYEAELEIYKADMWLFGHKVYGTLLDMYGQERSAWEKSPESRLFAARQRELHSFADAYESLTREGHDVTMATLQFESWCGLHRKRLRREIRSPRDRPVEWELAPPPKRLNP